MAQGSFTLLMQGYSYYVDAVSLGVIRASQGANAKFAEIRTLCHCCGRAHMRTIQLDQIVSVISHQPAGTQFESPMPVGSNVIPFRLKGRQED